MEGTHIVLSSVPLVDLVSGFVLFRRICRIEIDFRTRQKCDGAGEFNLQSSKTPRQFELDGPQTLSPSNWRGHLAHDGRAWPMGRRKWHQPRRVSPGDQPRVDCVVLQSVGSVGYLRISVWAPMEEHGQSVFGRHVPVSPLGFGGK